MAFPPGNNIKSLGLIAVTVTAVTGAISRASGTYTGKVQLAWASHGKVVGDYVTVSGVTGTVEANGTHRVVEVVNANAIVIDVTFANAFSASGIGTSPTRITVNYTDLVTVPVAGSGVLSIPSHQWVLSMLTSNTGRIWVGVVPNMNRVSGYGVIADRTAGGIVDATMFGGPTNSFDVRNVWIDAEINGEGAYGSLSIH